MAAARLPTVPLAPYAASASGGTRMGSLWMCVKVFESYVTVKVEAVADTGHK